MKLCYGDSGFLLLSYSLAAPARSLVYFIFRAHFILFAAVHNSSIESHFFNLLYDRRSRNSAIFPFIFTFPFWFRNKKYINLTHPSYRILFCGLYVALRIFFSLKFRFGLVFISFPRNTNTNTPNVPFRNRKIALYNHRIPNYTI